MAEVATGLWYDYSQSSVLRATLTLSVGNANYLLSALTFLVTLAAASFWNITAFVLHHLKVGKTEPDDVDLQHRVLLRNPAPASGSIISLVKVHWAWRGKNRRHLLGSTCGVLLPALLILACFSAASILVSRVANKSYGGTLARLTPDTCGILLFNNDSSIDATAWRYNKVQNDTLRARAYVRDFYYGSQSSASASSLFPQATLNYSYSASAPCPFPNTSRCALGENGAFSMTTDFLDSHNALGINAQPDDRIELQISVTCSPLVVDDLLETTERDSQQFVEAFMGPVEGTNLTSTYQALVEPSGTRSSYLLWPVNAVIGTDPTESGVWIPTADFNRTDADISAFFLTQYRVAYLTPVHDPWFSANRPLYDFYASDSLITAMGCADQYIFCNPKTKSCTDPGALAQSYDSAWGDSMALNAEQQQTLRRVFFALIESSTYLSVFGLKQDALWANIQLFAFTSSGLPDNQWQFEALGWFQTSLTKLQAYVLEYASKAGDTPGPGGSIENPWDTSANPTDSQMTAALGALQNQCSNQLVSTTGQVQNFSFLGVMVIVCVSVVIILLDWSLETMANCVFSRKKPSAGKIARQVDNRLHLLRMAMPDSGADGGWEAGSMDVPIRATRTQVVGPVVVTNGLASFRKGESSSVVSKMDRQQAPTQYWLGESGYQGQSGWSQGSNGWRQNSAAVDHQMPTYVHEQRHSYQ